MVVRLTVALVLAGSFCRVASVSALDPNTPIQQYARASWTSTDGLPSNLIWAATQDRRGYIWFGTDAGLVRFDGIRFVTWNDLGGPSLPATSVRSLLESRAGDLWVGFGDAGGLARIREGHVTDFRGAEGIPGRAVALLEDAQGTIWVGGLGGLARFLNDHWEHVGQTSGLDDDHQTVTQLYEDRQDTIWVVMADGLVYRRSSTERRFQRVTVPFAIRSLVEDSSGDMLLATDGHGLLRLTGADGYRYAERFESPTGRTVLVDREGNVWIGTQGEGLWRITPTQRRARATAERLTGVSTPSNSVRSLLEDREGNIWVGTQNGVTRLSERSPIQMSSIRMSPNVRAVTVTGDGRVWVGTEDGLYRFRGNDLTHFDHYDASSGIPAGVVTALHTDHDGVLWAITTGGLVRFDGARFVPVPLPPTVAISRIWAITIDADSGLWMCDIYKGLFLWKDDKVTSFETITGIKAGLCSSAITDRSRRVWIGFSNGSLAAYQDGKFRLYSVADGLAGGTVTTIAEDNDGVIWAGTNKGLSRFDGERFVSVTGGKRSPIVDVREIAFDEQEYIWLGVSAGIVRLHRSEFDKMRADPSAPIEYALYNMSDGLRGLPMLPRGYPTAVRDPAGILWFVTSDGLAAVNPLHLRKARRPPVVIERITADDRVLDPQVDVALPPLTARIQVDYTAPTFSNPAKTRFRYKLDGFDPGWVDAGTRRQASYTNLPPRRYQFRVLAGNDEAWSEINAVWTFSIRPAFYQTRWFLAASLVTLAVVLLSAWRLRVRHVRHQFALVLAERARVARGIHDTLLQSLVGIAFQFDALESEIGSSAQEAKNRVERLRLQVGMYIREARQSIWDLRSPSLDQSALPDALRRIVTSTSHDTIALELLVEGTPYPLVPRTEEMFLRVAQEATSNAVRHGESTRVRIELWYMPDSVTLRVVDDGRGFDPGAQGADHQVHWGLAIMEERATLAGAQFRILTTQGRGTEIEIIAPTPPLPRG